MAERVEGEYNFTSTRLGKSKYPNEWFDGNPWRIHLGDDMWPEDITPKEFLARLESIGGNRGLRLRRTIENPTTVVIRFDPKD